MLLTNLLFVLFAGLCSAGTAHLSSYPLAVRSPYLSAWLPGNETSDITKAQVQFWNGQSLTWPVLARVGDATWALFGLPNDVDNVQRAEQTGISYTSTHTTISATAGDAVFTLDFFSPVSPENFIRQSLPFSYLTITAETASASNVQILSAIDDTWTAQQGHVNGVFDNLGSQSFFTLNNPGSTFYTENKDMATWGSVQFASEQSNSSSLSHQLGDPAAVYGAFAASGKLSGDTPAYSQGNLLAFAHDLGSVTGNSSVTFAVGHVRDHAINFLGAAQTPYYRSTYPNDQTAIPHFFADYEAALAESRAFDEKVQQKGDSISSNYTDLLEASVRQAFGAMEVTLPYDKPSTDQDPLMFLKEISSDGNVNTVDVIMPTHPILYALCPDWIRYLLTPYLIYQSSGAWPNDYIVHDMGAHYPNAIGHNDGQAEDILIEATGDFLAMLYAYHHATNATTDWLQPYQNVLTRAANYLYPENTGLYTPSQRSTVDAIPASANQTTLSMSGTIGLKAIGKLLNMDNYTSQASHFADVLYTQGLALDSGRTHFTYNYGAENTWVTTFSLWDDYLLGLNTFPQAANEMMGQWYSQHFLPSGGILYSNKNEDFTISEWAMFAGAVSAKSGAADVQEKAIDMVWSFITNGLNTVPFPTKFDVQGADIGKFIVNKARPTVGSMWAPIVLQAW